MYKRKIDLTSCNNESFFLWGPRQTGKTTLLKESFPDAVFINLLNNREFAKYTKDPHLLVEEIAVSNDRQKIIIIDEIQKVPALLDEVHLALESQQFRFALCGSSARKVRRGHANLLGGRALRFELFGLVSTELGTDFDLIRCLNHGNLPKHYSSQQPRRLLNAYVADYLREEIANEGLVRNLPAFSDFLRAAAIGDTEILNLENIARECGIAATTVKGYYEILIDTLLAQFLPAFTNRPKRRTIQAPKFYFRNVGVTNTLLRRKQIEFGTELFGKAFENWCFHEISAHSAYSEDPYPISYWRLTSGAEVDFVLGNATCAIEIKGTDRVRDQHLGGLLAFREEYPEVKELIVVCLESKPRRLANGILVCPLEMFLERLWSNSLATD
jgi:uncharacterized protein